MKYDLSIGTGQERNAKDLNKRSKRWLVKRVQWLQLLNKQAITDHAMELNKLRGELAVERQSVEHWKKSADECERARKNRSNELQKTVSKSCNQEQIIRKLGHSISLAGEAIAHL